MFWVGLLVGLIVGYVIGRFAQMILDKDGS
jgi:uncharacterized membrane-anchored protein YhcB (DUF1043 family)